MWNVEEWKHGFAWCTRSERLEEPRGRAGPGCHYEAGHGLRHICARLLAKACWLTARGPGVDAEACLGRARPCRTAWRNTVSILKLDPGTHPLPHSAVSCVLCAFALTPLAAPLTATSEIVATLCHLFQGEAWSAGFGLDA